MALDLAALEKSMLAAIENTVGSQSQTLIALAGSQVAALANTAAYIEANKDTVDAATLAFMLANHQDAVEGVLKGFEGISLTIAQQAADAAVNALITAINAAKILPFAVAAI
jgi:prophage maintenance system killer protein